MFARHQFSCSEPRRSSGGPCLHTQLGSFLSTLAVLGLAAGTVARGATQYAAGSFTWDNASTSAWGPATGGPYASVWTSENDAVLEGAPGTVTIASPTAHSITFNTTGYVLSGASTLTLNGATPTLLLGSGVSATIGNNTATVLGGSVGLTKAGLGTVTLNPSAVSTLTGGISVAGGTFLESFANLAAPTDLLNSGNVLTLGGGTLSLTGKGSAVTSQSFASTTLNGGGSVIALTQNGATSLTVALGAITRNAGSTLSFSVVPGTSGVIATTSTGNEASGILGPWVSAGATTSLQYGTVNGSSQLVSYTGATPDAGNLASVTSAGVNYSYAAVVALASSATGNTLRYAGGATTTTVNSPYTLTLNGLMNAGSGALTLSGTGSLVIGANRELVILANGQTITITPRIVDNAGGSSSLVFGGTGGTLSFNAVQSTYSGGTFINAGTATTAASGNATDTPFGTGAVTVNPGAALALNRTYVPNNVTLNNATLTSGNSFAASFPAGYTITLNGMSTFNVTGGLGIFANTTGAGGLIKTGASTVPLTGGNTYTGPTIINAGALKFKASLYGNDTAQWVPASITVSSNAQLVLNVGGAGEFTIGQFATLFSQLTTGVYSNGLRAGSQLGIDTSGAGASGVTTCSAVLADSSGPGGGAVGIKHFGAGTLELTGSNTYSGLSITDANGTLKVSSLNSVNGGSPPLASSSLGRPTTIANGTIWLGTQTTFSGGGLTYTGTGETTDRVLNLGGANASTYNLDQSGSGLLKFTSAFTITDNRGPKTINLKGSTAGQGEIAGVIPLGQSTGNPNHLTKSGTGVWILSAANLNAGGVYTVSGGALVLNHTGAVPGGIDVVGGASALTFNGGVIGLGADDFKRNLAAAGTIAGVNFTGNGGWAAYGTNRVVNLGGASTQVVWGTANTGFNAKTLILGHATASHTVDFQNPMDLGTAARTVQVDDGAAALDARLSGKITGGTGGNLNKSGNGTLALTGANDYAGTTTVSAGCLLIQGTNSGTGLITVSADATNGGIGTVAGPVTYSAGSAALFTVTPDPFSSLTNLTAMTMAGVMSFDGTVVHLNAPANLPSGTYLLASSTSTPVLVSAFPAPVLDSGSYAPGVTNAGVSLDTVGNRLLLTVDGLSTNPTRLAILSVNGGASPTAGVGFSVVVQAQDENGTPRVVLTDTAVTFSLNTGGGLLTGTLTGTIPAGSSSVTISGVLYMVAESGVSLTATRTGGDSLAAGNSSPFTVFSDTAPNHLTVTGFPTPVTAGATGSVTVTVCTLGGATVTHYAGTVHFTSTALSAGLPADYAFVPATDNGVHVFTGVTLNTAGTQTLTVTDTATPSIAGGQTNIVVNPDNVSQLAVAGFPSPEATNVAGSVTVTAQDAYANTATNYTGTIQFTSSDSLALLPADYTFLSGDLGVHLFTNGVIFRTLGTNSITATDTVAPSIAGAQTNIIVWIWPIQFGWTNSAGGTWSAAANWTNDQGVVLGPLTNGQANYTLSFGTGSYTSTHNLADGFLLNQLRFGGGVTIDSPLGFVRALTFTNNGVALPQILQGGSSWVQVLNPITLGADLTFGGAGNGPVSLSGAISGAGGLIKTNAVSPLYIGGANTYSGGTTISAGTVVCGTAGLNNPLGSGQVTLSGGTRLDLNATTFTNAFAVYGGTLQNGNGFQASVNGPVYLGADSTVDVSATGNMTIRGDISGPGGLMKLGTSAGPLILYGTNTFTGPLTISAGTVRLGAGGSISSAASISIAAGATFDVSAFTSYALSGSNGLSAAGTAVAATLKGAVTVSLGSQPIRLTYDGANPALTVSQGALQLSGNPFTVVVPGPALTWGLYTLVSCPNGVTGTVNPIPSFAGGNGVAAGTMGRVFIEGNSVILRVGPAGMLFYVR